MVGKREKNQYLSILDFNPCSKSPTDEEGVDELINTLDSSGRDGNP